MIIHRQTNVDATHLAFKVSVSYSSESCTAEEEAVPPPPSKCTSLYQTETLSPRLASALWYFATFDFT